ncbi:MAG: polysaccharide biosynthesis C-terminal domain-containing protein [Peptococcaceae bacterium]|jgi:putative MATE family efflux protein|nr:polysaccharide biosynthesis C-terminal domain-containing protein [Peptococcaceae bacterium]
MISGRTKELTRYIVPTVLSNCAFFLFTVVDGIFVGRGVGTDALGAVNLALPFVMIANALFMLATIGGVTVAAIRLGRGDKDGASQAFAHALIGVLLISTLLSGAGVFGTNTLAGLLGANDTFHALVVDYLFWYAIFLIPMGLTLALQGFCRNDGSPVLVSASVIISTILNIFGDWLLIFPLGMGVRGAAIATGVSQSLGLAVVALHFLQRRGSLRLGGFRFQAPLFLKIVGRGLPEMIGQFAMPVTTVCMNYALISRLGDVAVNAYSITSYVASFSVAIFVGSSEGLQPLFGQSYGRRDGKSLSFYFRAGAWINLTGSVAVFGLIFLLGGPICALFNAAPAVYAVTLEALPRYAWSFIPIALNTHISAYLYSTKRTKESILLNTCRSLIFNSSIIFALPAIFGDGLLWFTAGIAETLAMLLAFILLVRSERNGVVFQ